MALTILESAMLALTEAPKSVYNSLKIIFSILYIFYLNIKKCFTLKKPKFIIVNRVLFKYWAFEISEVARF